jgi:DNA-binding NtrC family response regulator
MSDNLDLIIVDDDSTVCQMLTDIVKRFYVWGQVHPFTDPRQALEFCLEHDSPLLVFIVDIFLKDKSGFLFLDAVAEKYSNAHQDAIVITGHASDDVVSMCVASEVHHLLEKPVRPYALQLAVRSIVSKYMTFAKKLLQDPLFADNVRQF